MNTNQHPNLIMRRLFNELHMLMALMPEKQWAIRLRIIGYFDDQNIFHPFNLDDFYKKKDIVRKIEKELKR